MRNLVVRSLSGLVLLGIVLGAILWSPATFAGLLLTVLVGGQLEFYKLARHMGAVPQRGLGIAAGAVLFLLSYSLSMGLLRSEVTVAMPLLFCLLLFIPLMFFCELFRRNSAPLFDLAATVLGVVYVAVPLSLMLFIPLMGDDRTTWRPAIVLSYIFVIWANDVFAYLVGVAIGRHRLCERLSPKKTWEGFFGGVIGAVATGAVAARVMDASCGIWIGLALIASISGVLGDLTESMFKREADLKDSGRAIPGHGGVLDRFDALLLSAPFVLGYLLLLTLFE